MRAELSAYLHTLAQYTLGATIIVIPFRYRIPLQERPLPPIYRDYTDLLLFPSDIFLIATLILWIFGLAIEPRRLKIGPFLLGLPIAGLTAAGIWSIFFSVDRLLSAYHSIRLVLLAGLYVYLVNEITGLGTIVLSVAIQVFIQAAVAIGQVLNQHSLGLEFLGELELDPAWAGVSIVAAEGIRSLRAYGLSDHPNILGGCLALALIVIATWYIKSETKWRAPGASLFALGAVGLLLTFSRSAWLAFAAGIALMALTFYKTGRPHALRDGLALLTAALIVVLPFAWQNADYLGVRLGVSEVFSQSGYENRSMVERGTLNRAASAIFADHALVGVGLGTLPLALHNSYPDFSFDYQPAHIALVDVAAEVGIFGAFFYMAATIGPWLALWLRRDRISFPEELVGATGLLLALTVVGFFDYYTWLLAPGRLWQWLVWGVWGAIYRTSYRGAGYA